MTFDLVQIEDSIKEKLLFAEALDDNQNLLELGLNSLQVMRLINQWRKQGIKVSFGELMEEPVWGMWKQLLSRKMKKSRRTKRKEAVIGAGDPDVPFPLTDVQYAYWAGREASQVLGGIGCHAYLEFDGRDVQPERLERSWKLLLAHHPMLRAVFLKDGTQKIAAHPYAEALAVHDLRTVRPEELEAVLLQHRERLSHRKLAVAEGQVAGLELSLLPEGKTRIHFDLDLLVADVQSMQIILRDLARLYQGQTLSAASAGWSFRDYLNQQETKYRHSKAEDRSYWLERLEQLPAGPQLPLLRSPEQIETVRIRRIVSRLDAGVWEQLKARTTSYGTTPAMVLLTAYAKVMERWSASPHFLLNLPLFNRQTEDDGMDDVVADFTTLLLLEVDERQPAGFLQSLQRIQKQLRKDMGHTGFSGVELQREMMKREPEMKHAAPVVFACNIGNPLLTEEFRTCLGDFSYMISQTPQVWLDFQMYEQPDGLMLTWDAVEGLFPDGMLRHMLDSMTGLLNQLAVDGQGWEQQFDLLPEEQQTMRHQDLQVTMPEAPRLLHQGIPDQAKTRPDAVAVIDTGTGAEMTYQQLADQVRKIGFCLNQAIGEGQLVAVTLPRGIPQVLAVLGILTSGNGYVPVSVTQPEERRALIHRKVGISYVLTNRGCREQIQWPEDVRVLAVEDLIEAAETAAPEYVPARYSPAETAYVILTSGSTGEPKGVEISHGSAWNTIQAVNEGYGITDQDSVLAVSALDFDLSVYDIFGVLDAGGTLVMIPDEETKNAAYWYRQIMKYGISVWNSVPILLDMLLTYTEQYDGQEEAQMLPLKTVMLSGDWIGLDLPERLRQHTAACHLYAMGGATEASIWSNYYPVKLPVPADWKSIPYGGPLAHQVYRVVDEKGRDCPDWVPGELLIGGAGVAKGYRGDPKLTAAKFFDASGLRWYRTGDMGRFWNDHTIEFLGRKDYQVKIRGHRIELGEIEAVLRQCEGIRDCAVIVTEMPAERSITAYVVAERDATGELFTVRQMPKQLASMQWEEIVGELKQLAGAADELVPEAGGYRQKLQELTAQAVTRAAAQIGSVAPQYQALKAEFADEAYLGSRDILAETAAAAEAAAVETGVAEAAAVKAPDCGDEPVAIRQYLGQLEAELPQILSGLTDVVALFYAEKPGLSPNALLKVMPGYEQQKNCYQQAAALAVRQLLAGRSGDGLGPDWENGERSAKIRILEVGSRDPESTGELLESLKDCEFEYVCADQSLFFLNQARVSLAGWPQVTYELLNPEQNEIRMSRHSFDCIVSSNALHRTGEPAQYLQALAGLLAPGGLLVMTEITRGNSVSHLVTTLLEQGQVPRLDAAEVWCERLTGAGFAKIFSKPIGQGGILEQQLILAQNQLTVTELSVKELTTQLTRRLPEYMLPKHYLQLNRMPVTGNGKVDRKALKLLGLPKEQSSKRLPETATQRRLAALWEVFFAVKPVGIDDNYFELGGDSLAATRLIASVAKAMGRELSIGSIFEYPTIARLAEWMDSSQEASDRQGQRQLPALEPQPIQRYEPFPLTDVQHAYWMGRSGFYDLGEVATHCYFELDTADVDMEQLNLSWQRLIRQHDMMRVVLLPDGRQQILKETPDYQIQVTKLKVPEKVSEQLTEIRQIMSHQVIDVGQWPLFDVRATCYGDRQVRLHISFDNLIFDGWSMFHLLGEWNRLYQDCRQQLPKLTLSFRDYVLGMEQIKASSLYEQDREYWLERLDTLAPAPELPVRSAPAGYKQLFARAEYILDKQLWTRLKTKAGQTGITPAVLLMTAYGETLRRWSQNPCLTINLTMFQRTPLHPEVEQLVGDFTTLTLLEMDPYGAGTFAGRAQKVQKQLTLDLEHPYYSGVEMQRELARHRGLKPGAVMPVVFTSGLGINEWNQGSWIGRLAYNVSQTPQVWLDHQVVEQDGNLCLFWDYVEHLFEPEIIGGMFDSYCRLLRELAECDSLWERNTDSLITVPYSEARKAANRTEQELPVDTLDGLFIKSAVRYENREAVVDQYCRLSYGELWSVASGLARQLIARGIGHEEVVAVYMEKGWEQVAAVLGILLAGGAYLPLDTAQPYERAVKIMADSQVRLVLTQPWLQNMTRQLQPEYVIAVDPASSDNRDGRIHESPGGHLSMAYIIYTSGSTGMPKGVVIEHGAAVNTILDINRRYQVTEKDKAFALSALHFDLSVYDVFGMLAAGGTIVIPDKDKGKDPAHWFKRLSGEGVTMWNSVPALMQMLTEYLTHRGTTADELLSVVLLSGDWIPTELPAQIRAVFRRAQVAGLGGATECSIWSNAFDIPVPVPASWISIPYGKPLSNQQFYVLDRQLQEAPDLVPGMLYIGGTGLARGYHKDPEKTARQFITWGQDGRRLYCTGDKGRYLSDGNIEFLGREDQQVKVDGYRVELGEIEAAILKTDKVKRVTVLLDADGQLAAFVAGSALAAAEDVQQLREILRSQLPDYMIPKKILPVSELPLTANGKIDREQLQALAAAQPEHSGKAMAVQLPSTLLESQIYTLWKDVLHLEELDVSDNFFDCGGNSLQAVSLVNGLTDIMAGEVGMEVLFEHPTVSALAAYFTDGGR